MLGETEHLHRRNISIFKQSLINTKTNTKNQIAENCKDNLKLATLFEIPHVGCNSNRSNLQVRRMLSSNISMK